MDKNDETTQAFQAQSNIKSSTTAHIFHVLIVITLLFLGTAGAYLLQQSKIDKLSQQANRHQAFMSTPNQACLGLSTGTVLTPTLTKLEAKQTLLENKADGRVAHFTCTIGQNTKSAVAGLRVAKVDSDGREMGAEVIYFDTAEHANAFHKDTFNKQRYWSVPNNTLTDGIPAFKYFTSYVPGNPVYFDAYAVKDKMIMRVTLPCDNSTAEKVTSCYGTTVDDGTAISVLRSFAETVKPLDF